MAEQGPTPHPDDLLTRDQTAQALTERGLPVRPKTLATKAVRGGGPPFRYFGTKPLYRWGDSLAWAQSRLSSLRTTTSDTDGQRKLTPKLQASLAALAENPTAPVHECDRKELECLGLIEPLPDLLDQSRSGQVTAAGLLALGRT